MLANPQALWLLLLATVLVALYGWSRRPATEPVTTGFLWDEILHAHTLRSVWRPWRRWASLAVAVAMLALLAAALAEPRSRRPIRQTLLFHTAGLTETQLHAAKTQAEVLIDALADDDRLAIIEAGEYPVMHCGPTANRNRLRAAIAALSVAPGPVDSQVLAQAQRIAAVQNPDGDLVHVKSPSDLGVAQPPSAVLGESAQPRAAVPPSGIGTPSPQSGWWWTLAAAALALVVIEWPLAQRRWLE